MARRTIVKMDETNKSLLLLLLVVVVVVVVVAVVVVVVLLLLLLSLLLLLLLLFLSRFSRNNFSQATHSVSLKITTKITDVVSNILLMRLTQQRKWYIVEAVTTQTCDI